MRMYLKWIGKWLEGNPYSLLWEQKWGLLLQSSWERERDHFGTDPKWSQTMVESQNYLSPSLKKIVLRDLISVLTRDSESESSQQLKWMRDGSGYMKMGISNETKNCTLAADFEQTVCSEVAVTLEMERVVRHLTLTGGLQTWRMNGFHPDAGPLLWIPLAIKVVFNKCKIYIKCKYHKFCGII